MRMEEWDTPGAVSSYHQLNTSIISYWVANEGWPPHSILLNWWLITKFIGIVGLGELFLRMPLVWFYTNDEA